MNQCKTHKRLGLGIVLIIAGAIFLLGNLGFIPDPIYNVLTSWPMILVAIGTISLIKRDFTPAIILYAIAAYFLLPYLIPGVSFHEIWRFWPVLLIIIGLSFLFRQKKNNKPFEFETYQQSDEVIDEVAVFGGKVIQVESPNFKGGKITSVFGGSEIHFTRARMSEQGAVIDVATVFGGTKLVIPRDWTVKLDVVSIFGGFSDKRLYVSPDPNSNKTLHIKGVAIFGGGELISI
jgi:predicted membrane protein